MVLGEIEEWKPNKVKGKKKAESGESQQGEGRENAQARYARNG